jgi:hypothetical protein
MLDKFNKMFFLNKIHFPLIVYLICKIYLRKMKLVRTLTGSEDLKLINHLNELVRIIKN